MRETSARTTPHFPVTCEIRPRFRDTDAIGHVNNAVFVTYLEVGRQAYWERVAGSPDYGSVPFILAQVRCDFRSPALVNDVLVVSVRCEWIRSASFGFAYEIRERASGRLVVEATSVQVCYDYAAGKSVPVSGELRGLIEGVEGRALGREASA